MSRLRLAVIGGGNIAQQHLPVLTNHPLCEVAVLCEPNPVVLAATGDRFHIEGRVAMDFFGPGSHRFELRSADVCVASDAPFLGATVHRKGAGRERLEQDEDDRKYKPGFWKQDTVFLEGVRDGRQPVFPAATLEDAYGTMRLIDQLYGSEE